MPFNKKLSYILRGSIFMFITLCGLYGFQLINNSQNATNQMVQPQVSFSPKGDSAIRSPLIRTESNAIKYGYMVCKFFYGNTIKRYKPFRAVAEGDSAWHIYGTPLKFSIGGEPHLRINKYDLRIYEIYFTK